MRLGQRVNLGIPAWALHPQRRRRPGARELGTSMGTRLLRLSPAIAIGCLLAAGLVLAALASACVPQASISVDPRSGPSGSQVTVTGSTFGQRAVEIRWNSLDGQVLATARGPEFTATVTIPAASGGVKILKAVAYDPDGTVAGSTGAPFEVTAPAESPPSAGAPGSAPAPGSPEAPASPQAPTAPDAPGSRPPARSPSPRAPEGDGGRAEGERAPAGRRGRTDSPPTDRTSSGVVARGGREFFAGSVASADGPAVPARKEAASSQAPGSPASRRPGERSAAADLWSGFRGGSVLGLGATDASSAADAPGGQLWVGVALLGLGLLTLLAALAIIVVRRRRSTARLWS